MSKKKEEIKIDEKTKKRNIALSRRAAEMSGKASASISVSGSGKRGSVSTLSSRKDTKKSDVAKSITGFKSVGSKAKSKADNLKKNTSGLGPKAHGANSNYSSHNNFGLK